MANVIIKSNERRARENKILNDLGRGSRGASRQDREYAACIAEKTNEQVLKIMKKESR